MKTNNLFKISSVILVGALVFCGIFFLCLSFYKRDVNVRAEQKNTTTETSMASFGSPVALQPGQTAVFEDGLKVTLIVIHVSSGEISPILLINNKDQIILGSVTQKELREDGYTFELQDVSKNFASIIVTKNATATSQPCYVGGCSSEICSDQQNVVSSCIYKSEYECYKSATCARQADGQCGWTQTQELVNCVKNSQ